MAPSIPAAVAATFRALGASESAQVPAVLAAALDVPREAIQYAAALAILERTSEHELFELVQRLPLLPKSVVGLVASQSATVLPAFRQALLHGSPESRRLACAAIRATGLAAPLPYVLELVQQPQLPDHELAVETLRDVVDQLFNRSQQPGGRTALRSQREQVLQDLAKAVEHWEQASPSAPHDRRGTRRANGKETALSSIAPRLDPSWERGGEAVHGIAQGILILGEPAHPVVRRVLWHGSPATHEVMYRLLQESRHPGVLQFLTASLHERYPHPQVFVALRERRDPEFVAALLRMATGKLSPQVEQNLQQVEQFRWLELPHDRLETVPQMLQPALATFVQATRLPRHLKAAVLEWLLRHGTPSAKLAATEGLSLIDQGLAQDVVRENLNADDAAVQAWATSQLRHCALPDAYALLVERLESPHAEVRAAARRELAGFNTERVLSLADELSPDDARRAGQLLLKVVPDARAQLTHELLHPARQKRIRTARRILHLGLQTEMADTVVALTEDVDPLVRRTAAELLEQVPTPLAREALLVLLDDDHPRVRETAAAALERGHHAAVALSTLE